MKDFSYFVPVKVVFGCGILDNLGEECGKYGDKALLVTTGSFFKEIGLIDRISNILTNAGIDSLWYGDITPNPHHDQINSGAKVCINEGCTMVIGVGGGSAIDAAKGIAVGAGHKRDVWDFAMGCHDEAIDITPETLPIIAITTTSGTGSHITPYSVISNSETKQKPGLASDYIYPKVAIVDPELMKSVPRKITAATGFDILAHVIEAYTSKSSDPVTELYCEKAFALVGKYLAQAVENGENMEAREALALADTFAGFSIAVAGITLCHSMAHAVGGVSETVHGETLAAMTPHTIRFSMNNASEKFIKIGKYLKYGYECEEELTVEEAVVIIEDLINEIGLTAKLGEQGVAKSDLEEIADHTLHYMAGPVEQDPRIANKEDIVKILEQSF